MNRYDAYKVASSDPLDVAYEKTNNALAEISTDIEEVAEGTANPSWSAITGKPATFPATEHSHGWTAITGKPTSFPPAYHSHGWNEITGKPSTFPPTGHGHTTSQVTGLDEKLSATEAHQQNTGIHRKITFGTGNPTGGVDGDIYLKHQ